MRGLSPVTTGHQVHGGDKHLNDPSHCYRCVTISRPFVCSPVCFLADNQGDFQNKITGSLFRSQRQLAASLHPSLCHVINILSHLL